MFNRIIQFCRFFKTGKIIIKEDIKGYLSEEEWKIFDGMSDFDKRHSLNVLKEIEKIEINDEKKLILRKMALLHDVGKPKETTLFERIAHALTKNGKRLKNHPQEGAAKIREIDPLLGELISLHHCDTENEIIKIFQKADNKN